MDGVRYAAIIACLGGGCTGCCVGCAGGVGCFFCFYLFVDCARIMSDLWGRPVCCGMGAAGCEGDVMVDERRWRDVADLPEEFRPRERLFRFGPKALSDAEIVAVLLGSGTPRCGVLEMAERFCNALGNDLTRLAGRQRREPDGMALYESIEEEGFCGPRSYRTFIDRDPVLREVMTESRLGTLMAAQELGRRVFLPDEAKRRVPILRASQAVECFLRMLPAGALPKGVVWWVLFVDGRRVPIGNPGPRELSSVPVGEADDDFSERRRFMSSLLRLAVVLGARGIFLARVNPEGDVAYSHREMRLAEALAEAARSVGIAMHDCLMVARPGASPGYVSFRAGGVCRF